jgi:hypothetical protein
VGLPINNPPEDGGIGTLFTLYFFDREVWNFIMIIRVVFTLYTPAHYTKILGRSKKCKKLEKGGFAHKNGNLKL